MSLEVGDPIVYLEECQDGDLMVQIPHYGHVREANAKSAVIDWETPTPGQPEKIAVKDVKKHPMPDEAEGMR